MGATLVVGGTGILRPAVLTLLAGGADVLVVGRRRERIAVLRREADPLSGGLGVLATDATDSEFAASVRDEAARLDWPLSSAVVYAPATSTEATATLADLVSGRLVEVLTSGVGVPTDGSEWRLDDLPARPWARLVLGWRYDADGAPAWHDPDEISAAALRALDAGSDRTLGTLTPWSDRPAR